MNVDGPASLQKRLPIPGSKELCKARLGRSLPCYWSGSLPKGWLPVPELLLTDVCAIGSDISSDGDTTVSAASFVWCSALFGRRSLLIAFCRIPRSALQCGCSWETGHQMMWMRVGSSLAARVFL